MAEKFKIKKGDQEFDECGYKIVLDMKSFLYLAGTELDFSDGLNGKGFNFIKNPWIPYGCSTYHHAVNGITLFHHFSFFW